MIRRLTGRKGVVQRRRRKRIEPLCRMCREKGRITKATIVDHIVPLVLGGTDDDSNTRSLCDECHLFVTAEQFGYKKPSPTIGTDGWPVDDQ